MEEDEEHKELQLLPASTSATSTSTTMIISDNYPVRSTTQQPPAPTNPHLPPPSIFRYSQRRRSPKLGVVDLQLSISVNNHTNDDEDEHFADEIVNMAAGEERRRENKAGAMKWEAGEQIRMAAAEKAYAERVRELTRREMEMAQSEFARARHVWQRAREEVERAERIKERATAAAAAAGACFEITCHSCRQRFRPNN